MKYTLILLLLGSLTMVSCTKQAEADFVPTTSNKSLLVGTGPFQKIWILTDLSIDQVPQKLSYAQKNYTKVYNLDGFFKSSDGFTGTWEMSNNSTLNENISNLPSGANTQQSFTIVSLSSYYLTLQYTINGSQITTTYTAGY